MTKLHFYQGLRTIGGTVVEIETPAVRCLFDFGLAGAYPFDPLVGLRPEHLLADCLKLGMMPNIPGIYRQHQLTNLLLEGWKQENKPVFFLISHIHIDHMGALGLLAEEIPVYMTQESLALYKALWETGEGPFQPHENSIGVQPGESISVADLSFEAIPVDHDIPGACGFQILTENGEIGYTGDFRLHGFNGQATLHFAERLRGCDICITEGVTASFVEDFDTLVPTREMLALCKTEAAVLDEIEGAVSQAKGMVFLNTYNRNLERMAQLAARIEKTGRTLVMEAEQAYLLETVLGMKGGAIYEPFDRPFTAKLDVNRLSREALLARPEAYVLQLPYACLLESLDFDPGTSLYIHANGIPLGEYDPAYEKLYEFLSKRGIPVTSLGTGGHAAPAHLKHVLERISPRYLIPLHSLKPEQVTIPGTIQVLPGEGSTYYLDRRLLFEKGRSSGIQESAMGHEL